MNIIEHFLTINKCILLQKRNVSHYTSRRTFLKNDVTSILKSNDLVIHTLPKVNKNPILPVG